MADDDQQAPQQRYWFYPYWTGPQAPAPRPVLRPQMSRRDTRPAQQEPPPVTPSPSRRQPQAAATADSRGTGGGAGSPQTQPQPTRLSSRPSPTRAHPLSPIREPNSSAAPAPASAPKGTKPLDKPATPAQPAAHEEVLKVLDIVVPQEKIIHEPPSDTKSQSKAVEKEKESDKEKQKEKKDKEGKEKKDKEKEKEHKEKKVKDGDGKEKEKEEKGQEHKEKKEKDKGGKETKEKEKEHKEKKDKDKHKEEHAESKVHSGNLHKELKAGVADMMHKLGATAALSAGHERHAHAPGAGTTVITLAGENKGASMKVSHAEAESKERRARKLDDDRKQEAHGAKGLTTFVNSNVQVVNNSLVFQSSCSSSDPGVHLKLSTKSKKKGDDKEAGGKGGAAAATKKK